jgi:hypothetical protein
VLAHKNHEADCSKTAVKIDDGILELQPIGWLWRNPAKTFPSRFLAEAPIR